mgnify:CR=1 FL=1
MDLPNSKCMDFALPGNRRAVCAPKAFRSTFRNTPIGSRKAARIDPYDQSRPPHEKRAYAGQRGAMYVTVQTAPDHPTNLVSGQGVPEREGVPAAATLSQDRGKGVASPGSPQPQASNPAPRRGSWMPKKNRSVFLVSSSTCDATAKAVNATRMWNHRNTRSNESRTAPSN